MKYLELDTAHNKLTAILQNLIVLNVVSVVMIESFVTYQLHPFDVEECGIINNSIHY